MSDTIDECRRCGARLRERTRPACDKPGPQVFHLWCHECGTIHAVQGDIVNRGPDDGGGFHRVDTLLSEAAPERAGRLAALEAENARLQAVIDKPREMLFADGREPTRNERHLANLLEWRQKEAQEAKDEAAALRAELARLAAPEGAAL
jgi:hypothetical protein